MARRLILLTLLSAFVTSSALAQDSEAPWTWTCVRPVARTRLRTWRGRVSRNTSTTIAVSATAKLVWPLGVRFVVPWRFD